MHAYHIVYNLECTWFDGIIVFAGDGTFHEVVNALLNRQDYAQLNISVTAIPAGSRNGVTKSISEQAGEQCGVKEMVWMACRAKLGKCDVTQLKMEF